MNRKTYIKICGLTRLCDADAVNRFRPDYAGLVFCDKSRRYVDPGQARLLRQRIDPSILTAGVFVDAPMELIRSIYRQGTIRIAQLHGSEDDTYIEFLRKSEPGLEIWKAFRLGEAGEAQLSEAAASRADQILLDHGAGSGSCFDWYSVGHFTRPFILAGGLTPENIADARSVLAPFMVDLSSGVETDGWKDPDKIRKAVLACL